MKLPWQKWIFETLYKNRYLYRFASTVPFAGQWRVWQRLVLSRLHGYNVLELGCGLGDLLADMIEAGYKCRAVEQSPEMVDASRSTLQKRHVGEPIWVIQGQAQCLPFTDASFDTVVSTFQARIYLRLQHDFRSQTCTLPWRPSDCHCWSKSTAR